MKRNPETAYLVSNEEFDKQLDELGWSPGDVVTMAGMYVERGMYSMKRASVISSVNCWSCCSKPLHWS